MYAIFYNKILDQVYIHSETDKIKTVVSLNTVRQRQKKLQHKK